MPLVVAGRVVDHGAGVEPVNDLAERDHAARADPTLLARPRVARARGADGLDPGLLVELDVDPDIAVVDQQAAESEAHSARPEGGSLVQTSGTPVPDGPVADRLETASARVAALVPSATQVAGLRTNRDESEAVSRCTHRHKPR